MEQRIRDQQMPEIVSDIWPWRRMMREEQQSECDGQGGEYGHTQPRPDGKLARPALHPGSDEQQDGNQNAGYEPQSIGRTKAEREVKGAGGAERLQSPYSQLSAQGGRFRPDPKRPPAGPSG